MNTITRPAALVRQGSLKLYSTSLKVKDLKRPDFYTISKLDPVDGGPGYQRLLNEGRAKRLADYLIDGQSEKDAFLPTSIFLATNKDIPFDSATNTITFDVAAKSDFKKNTIKALLKRGFENLTPEHIGMSHPEWWHRGGAASGLNRGAIGKLANALSLAINAHDNASGVQL